MQAIWSLLCVSADEAVIWCADMPEEVALKVEAVGKARLQEMSQALCLNTEVHSLPL